MQKLTKEWVVKADEDWQAAECLIGRKPLLSSPCCFHCQQCAEKYLKALLQELGLAIPYTHDISDLVDLVVPHYPALRRLRRGLGSLTKYAVNYRYPP